MQKLNNAVLLPYGAYFPVYDIESVDAKQKIWKGKRVPHLAMGLAAQDKNKIIFFSRAYYPEVNDMDMVYPEIEFKSKAIIGVKFWLIPKEKLLFGYEEPSLIARVAPGTIKFNKRMN